MNVIMAKDSAFILLRLRRNFPGLAVREIHPEGWGLPASSFAILQVKARFLGSSGAGAENPRLFRGGMNRAPPRLLSLCGIAIYPPRSITVLLGLLPAVEKTQAARTKPRKQLAWDHMPSVERP